MKRWICLLLCMVMALSLFAGCAEEPEESPRKSTREQVEDVAKDFAKALKKCDAEAIVDLFPEGFVAATGMEKDQTVDSIYEALTSYDNQDVTFTACKVRDAEKLDAEELEELQGRYTDLDIQVKMAYGVELKATKVRYGEESTHTQTLYVVKVGADWYIDPTNIPFI